MKKKEEAYWDFECRIYPFFSCSVRNSFSALSSFWDIRYTLQSIASGVLFLSSIMWSQGREGGKQNDSCSLNTFANSLYWDGSLTAFVCCPACMARSMKVVRRQLCSFNCWTMRALRSSKDVQAIVGVTIGVQACPNCLLTGYGYGTRCVTVY